MYLVKKKWTTAKKQEYNGFLYDSGFEARHAADLDLLLKASEIKGYDRQVNLNLTVNGYIVCQYRIDFVVYHYDGTIEYQEVKGYPTPVWVLKFKLFEALFCDKPNVKISVIQQGKYKAPKIKKEKKTI